MIHFIKTFLLTIFVVLFFCLLAPSARAWIVTFQNNSENTIDVAVYVHKLFSISSVGYFEKIPPGETKSIDTGLLCPVGFWTRHYWHQNLGGNKSIGGHTKIRKFDSNAAKVGSEKNLFWPFCWNLNFKVETNESASVSSQDRVKFTRN